MSDNPNVNMVVGRVNCLHFTLPPEAFDRDDILIAVEYGVSQNNPKEQFCRAWAQVGSDAYMRGLVDEISVPTIKDNDEQLMAIVNALNASERFDEALQGYIEHILHHDPDAIEDSSGGVAH